MTRTRRRQHRVDSRSVDSLRHHLTWRWAGPTLTTEVTRQHIGTPRTRLPDRPRRRVTSPKRRGMTPALGLQHPPAPRQIAPAPIFLRRDSTPPTYPPPTPP